MNTDIVLVYAVVAFFYVISPGPAIFLALSNGMSNFKAVVFSSLGNIIGLFLLSLVSIIGLGALIVTSSVLFLFVKIIGAVYLIYLGIKQFQLSRSMKQTSKVVIMQTQRSNQSYFFEGFFLAATNPKPILFFISIFPQFLDLEVNLVPQFFVLTFIFMSLSFSSLLSYGYLAKRSKRLFSNENGMRWFHRITGGLFIGMGLALLKLKNTNS